MDQLSVAGIERHEIPVSPERLIVVYVPPDTGVEVEPVALFNLIAADAGLRSGGGWQLASLDTMNLRHAGLYLGRQGSGYETKFAIIALYANA
jgi:hypothetical protein